jgi:mannosyltransferase
VARVLGKAKVPPAGTPGDVAGSLIRQMLGVVTLTVAAAIVRFATLTSQSFWYDEAVTARLVHKSLIEMLRTIPQSETAPPLYYLIAWPWARVVGSGDFALRSLSALTGTVTVPVAYAAGRHLVSRRAGLALAALAAFSPILVWYSQEARAYSLLVLLSSLSFLFFVRAWHEPTRAWLVCWSISSTLAITTYYFAAFLAAGELAALLLRHAGRRRALWLASAGPIAVLALLLPLAVHQARRGNARWIHSLPLPQRVEETFRQLAIPTPAPSWAGAGAAESVTRGRWLFAAALLAIALAALIFSAQDRQRFHGLLAAGVAAFVLVAVLLFSLVANAVLGGGRGDLFLYRGLLPVWLPLNLFLAAGLTARRTRLAGPAIVGLLCAASLALVIQIDSDRSLQRDDWRALARASRAPCGALVVVAPSFEADALLRYRPELRQSALDRVAAKRIIVLLRNRPPPLPHNRPAGYARAPAGFRLTALRHLQYWTLEELEARTPAHIPQRSLNRMAGPSTEAQVLETGRLCY